MSPQEYISNGEKARLPEVLSFEINEALIDDLSEFKRGEPLGWGATPLDPHHPDIKSQQEMVRRRTTEMFNTVPEGFSDEFADLMATANQSRLFHRLDRNYNSYVHRVQLDLSQTPDLLQETQYRVLTGNASPAEIIVVATQLGVPAYELSSLTHPYGQLVNDYLEEMKEQNLKAVTFVGGELYEEPEVVYSVKRGAFLHIEKGGVASSDEKTLLMTRTSTFGRLDASTTCHARTSFLLRLTDEWFDRIKGIPYDESWNNAIEQIAGFKDYVERTLESEDHKHAVLSSTTAYVVNQRLVESQLLDKDAYTARNRYMSDEAVRTATIKVQESASPRVAHRLTAAVKRLF